MASGTQTYGKLLNYEEYIDHQLRLTRSRIKMTDVITAGVTLVAAALGVLFFEVVLDHLFGLPLVVRQLILLAGLGAGGWYAVSRLVLPLARSVNALYAAKTIEETDPSFKNSLINYLELRRHRGEVSKSFLAAIEARAVGDLTKVEIDTVVNQRHLIQAVYALAALVVLFCLYAVSTPKSILDSARRALLADVVRPTNTRLVNIKPGDDREKSKVVSGEAVEFSAEVQGARPSRVVLHYSIDGGKFFATTDLKRGRKDYEPWKVEMPNVRQSMVYYLTGGDAESRKYRLEVLPAPMVVSVAQDLEFPAYTKPAGPVHVDGGNVDALEGTLVTIRARTNQAARSGSLRDGKTKEILGPPMTVSESNPYELIGQFRVKESGTYFIDFLTTSGRRNPEPAIYDIHAQKDLVPEVKFVRPEPSIRRPANAAVALQMVASDDFGLKEATLTVRRDGKDLRPPVNYLEKKPQDRKFRHVEVLDLAALKAEPGTTIQYELAVRDNKEPQSNRASARGEIIITEPVSEKERQQFQQEAQQAEKQPPPDDPERASEPRDDEPPMP
ncbi:MAG: hypothetical protein IRY99_09195, partial [Isosphaeraceae bacterium]|nr:hypothetical protein [Isosphaeraceae bacterium]